MYLVANLTRVKFALELWSMRWLCRLGNLRRCCWCRGGVGILDCRCLGRRSNIWPMPSFELRQGYDN